MTEQTPLATAILKHWREHLPAMVNDLEKHNRLEEAVREAAERTGDLLYELVSVKKLDYQAAWEIASREWAFLPEETRPPASAVGRSTASRKRTPSAKSTPKTGRRRRGPRGTSG